MGTRSVIALPDGNGGWAGRYCHWDGYPTHNGLQLVNIVRRDGLEQAAQVLVHGEHDWSSLDADATVSDANEWDRALPMMEGYGKPSGQGSDLLITHDGDECGTEWAYVLTPQGLAVHKRIYFQGAGEFDGFWRHRGTVPWDAENYDQLLVRIERGAL